MINGKFLLYIYGDIMKNEILVKPRIEIENKLISQLDKTINLIKEINIKEISTLNYMFKD